jgi:molecular chaperone GrpE
MTEENTAPEIEAAEAATPESAVAPDALALAQAEAGKWKDFAARTQAELENYRKRVVRDREDDIRRARAGLLEELLPVLDNFEFGMIEVRKGDPKSPIVFGMEMIERQLKEFMSGAGVEAIDATGKPFDPNVHEAVGQEASTEFAEGVVIRQMRRGFKLRDRLLRPAMVVVSKGAS